MTRIIAGSAGGTRLEVPAAGTRPTSDRVRESLFGALESADAIEGARVLDLYAGSGALGLESCSRGARDADLVERSRPAASITRKNAERVRRALPGPVSIHVHESAVRAFLSRTANVYDLVFLDPPYDLADDTLTDDLRALRPLLSPDALVVVERARRDGAPRFEEAGLVLTRERAYGDTALWWAEPADSVSDPAED